MGASKKDIHARLIMRYRDVAWWWYAGMTALVIVLAIITQEVWHTEMPRLGSFHGFCDGCRLHNPSGHCLCCCKLEQ